MNRPAHELLREGAQHLDMQTRGGFALRMDAAGRLRGCALGAIAIAAQGDPARVRASDGYRSKSLLRYLRLLATERPASQPCPGRGRWPWQGHHWTCARITRLGNQIAHLNDRHGWSFERIAAWLQEEHPDWDIPTTLDEATVPAGPVAGAIIPELLEVEAVLHAEPREPAEERETAELAAAGR